MPLPWLETAKPQGLALKEPTTAPGDPLAAAITTYRQKPTPEAADTYLKAIEPVIKTALTSYAGGDTPLARSHAKHLALTAAMKFDPARNTKVRTHLLTQLQGLRRYSANLESPVRVPEQLRLDAARVNRHANELELELGRSASDAEIADRLNIPISRIARARGAPAAYTEAAAPVGVQYTTPGPAAAARRTWMEAVYHDLHPVDQVVLEHSVGLNGKPQLSTGEIARKLGLSAGAVSQRKAKIEQMLGEFDSFMGGGK